MDLYCIVGEICGSFSNNVVCEWNIPEFYSKTTQKYSFCSPDMRFMGTDFYITIQRNDETHGLFCLYLKSTSNAWWCPSETVHFTLGIKISNGTKDVLCDGTIRKGPSPCSKYFLLSDILKRNSEVAALDTLRITCSFWIDAVPSVKDKIVASRETQTEDLPESGARGEECTHINTEGKNLVSQETDVLKSGAKRGVCQGLESKEGAVLRQHFKDLLLKGQGHDVTLKVKDKEFKAHKNILQARSPVFAAMFTHNMRETECGDVTIEDCDPETFGEFLQFVYTGEVNNLTPNNALGLYYVSDKYDFPHLKEMCVEYLKASLSTNMVCDVIHMAVKHSEKDLLDCSMAFFTDHTMEIWKTVEWQRFLKSNYILANELNIKAMEKVSQKDE